jgi:hypothetical protein
MTTGTRITDLRYADSLLNPNSLGGYAYKFWNGADAPHRSQILKRKAAESYPGSWHSFRAAHNSYLFELPATIPGKQGRREDGTLRRKGINKPYRDRKNIATIVARHHEVYNDWRSKMNVYLHYRSRAVEVQKQEVARTRETFNNYSCTIIRQLTLPCDFRNKAFITNPGGNPWYYGVSAVAVFGNPYSFPVIWNSNDDNALIEKLRSKLNGADFHAGVALAELEKTVTLFKDVAQTLRRFGEQVKAKNAPAALRVLYNGNNSSHIGWEGLPRAAKIYLGYQFGAKPLYEDVINGAKMLGWQAGYNKTNKIRVRRQVLREIEVTYPVTVRATKEERGQIVAYLTSKPRAIDFSGLTDVVSAGWERLMWSFVVDWWIPIGTALAAMHLAQKLTGKFITTRTTIDRRFSYRSGGAYLVLGDSSYRHQIQVNRTVSSTLISKLPALKPTFHPDLTVRMRHATEAGALLLVKRNAIKDGYDWLFHRGEYLYEKKISRYR